MRCVLNWDLYARKAIHEKKGRRSCFRQRNSLCKGPEAGMSLASFWISREAVWLG